MGLAEWLHLSCPYLSRELRLADWTQCRGIVLSEIYYFRTSLSKNSTLVLAIYTLTHVWLLLSHGTRHRCASAGAELHKAFCYRVASSIPHICSGFEISRFVTLLPRRRQVIYSNNSANQLLAQVFRILPTEWFSQFRNWSQVEGTFVVSFRTSLPPWLSTTVKCMAAVYITSKSRTLM